MIRAVLDANVYISAAIAPRGTSGTIVRAWVEESRIQVVASLEILEEVKRAIQYPRVRKYIQASDRELLCWISALGVLADMVTPTVLVSGVVRDPDDNKYIEAALEGRAEYLVSGDSDLLEIGFFQGIRVIKPADFIKIL